MARYWRIESITFDQSPVPLPISVRLSRAAEPIPASGDDDFFATSVQLDRPSVTADVRVRGTAAAESLTIGQEGDLVVTVASAESTSPARTITLNGAVLVGIELGYEQASMATAILRFVAEAADGNTDPFSAEESQ